MHFRNLRDKKIQDGGIQKGEDFFSLTLTNVSVHFRV